MSLFQRTNKRRRRGSAIAEAAASMSLMVPLMVLLMYVTVEVSYGCFLQANLSQAARAAARGMAIAYGLNNKVLNNRDLEDSMVFNQVKISNVVNDPRQFDDAYFQTTTEPHTVTVTVHYTSGQYNLPIFPFPDPLNLGDTFKFSAQHSYRLE